MSSRMDRINRTNEMLIKTPEGVSFSMHPAGPISRFLAWLLDICCILAATRLIQLISTLFGIIHPDFSTAISIILFFLINIAYAVVLEGWWRGQTIGKKIFGLRVMDINGLQLQLSQVVIRNLLRSVDSLPGLYLLGGLICLGSRHCRRLGDIAAGTIVVHVPKVEKPRIDLILEANTVNSLRDYPHLAARLRQQTTPAEAELGLQSILRRNELLPEARLKLFKSLADHFRDKVRFPEEAVGSISDEQYVRNAADLLFRR